MQGGEAPEGATMVRVLGPVTLVVDGTPVTCSGLQRRILARLAVDAPRAVSLGALVEAVWEDDPPRSARQAIQNQISRLRRLGGDELIETVADAYRLRTRTDLGELVDAAFQAEKLLAEGKAADAHRVADAALALWEAEPLLEIDHVDGVRGFRSSAETARSTAENLRMEAALALGLRGWALHEAERLARLTPLDERRAGTHARALVLNGRRGDALAVIADLRRRLRSEVGLGVGPEVAALEAEIVAPPVPTARPGPRDPAALRSPMVGRDRELTEVLEQLAAGRPVRVCGEPGSGVSRLLEEAAATLRSTGHRTVVVRAEEHPYSAVSLVEEILDDLGVAASSTHGALSAFAEVLAAVPADRPLALIVDDAHHIGPSSRRALVEAAAMAHVGVLLGAHEPLPLVPGEVEVLLGRLGERSVHRMARSLGHDDEELLRWVHRQAGGNPLAVELLLQERAEAGSGSAPTVRSPDLRSLVGRLVAGLDSRQREDLEVAALAGDGYPVAGFGALSWPVQPPPTDLVQWLEDGTQRFRHGALRSLLVDSLSRGRVVDLHHALGVAARAVGAPPATVARHLVAAAEVDPAEAIDAARAAARDAARLGAHADAAAWLARALAIDPGDDRRRTVATAIEHADELRLSGDADHVPQLVAVTELALDLGDEELVADAGFALLQLGGTSGAVEQAPGVAELARRVLQEVTEPERVAVLQASASLAWSMTGNAQNCLHLFEQAERAAVSPAARLRVLPFAYLALGRPGDLDRRQRLADELLTLSRTHDDAIGLHEALHLGFSVHLQTGDGDAARACVTEMTHLVDRLGDVGRRWAVLYCSAAVAHLDGDDEACEQLNREAFTMFAGVAPDRATALYGAQLLALRLGQGRLHELRPVLEDLVRDQPGVTAWCAAHALALAVPQEDGRPVTARPGDLELARRQARKALESAQDDFTWLASHVIGGSAAALVGDASLITAYRDQLEPWADRCCWQGSCSYGPVAWVLSALCAAAGDLDAAQRHALRGEELSVRLKTPTAIRQQRLVHTFGGLVPEVSAPPRG